jgi:hypothetical protein
MEMMRVLWLVVSASLAACWHGGGATTTGELSEQHPVSFVARVNGLGELQRKSDALEARLAAATHRILRLATETERTAIGDDLSTLTDEITHLAATARVARKRGDNPVVLDRVDAQLAEATASLAKLGEGLSYANTFADLEALENQHADIGSYRINGRIAIDDFDP